MVNYSKSMIYKLVCKNNLIKKYYIGSSSNFKNRKYHHKTCCINENGECYNKYKYKFIRDNGGFKNWDMILIENVNVDNKRDLEKIERDYIDKLKPSLNVNRSYITKEEKIKYKKEYNEENKECLCKKKKENYEKKKTEILEKTKNYREEYKEKYKEYDRKRYEENKNEILNKRKEYYEDNKEKVNKKRNEKINCEFCNCLTSKQNMKRHQQSVKCLKFQFIED